ncbi:MAG: metallophosphoesterase [Candidatus Binatia bacterium]|nr:metallophosphoesterase [Candidatus Binatia bacterium]MDG2008547.1 metallophosphoesterase [Candidatus Binatia bacterium]
MSVRKLNYQLMIVGLGAVLVSSCADSARGPQEQAITSYVILGGAADTGPAAYARAIVTAQSRGCPELIDDGGGRLPMSRRENPHGFSVGVCEAILPFEKEFRVSWSGQSLPLAALAPERLLLAGDTGCDADDCPPGTPAQPLQRMAQNISTLDPAPQVIIHVGDVNYRGTPKYADDEKTLLIYDAGDHVDGPGCSLDRPYISQNAAYSDFPDNWEDWWIEFFEPAEPLLRVAPLVIARGNHELCSRAGPGWLYFLDAGSNLDQSGQTSCPAQGGAVPPVGDVLDRVLVLPPRVIDLGTRRLVVIDSANACDYFAPESTTEIYAGQLSEVFDATDPDPSRPTWIVTHRPLIGVVGLCSVESDPDCRPEINNRTLQAAWLRAFGGPAGLSPVELVVSGHMHLFQGSRTTEPGSGLWPPQLVVGNGGVAAESGPGPGSLSLESGDLSIRGLTSSAHWFTTVTVEKSGGWSGLVLSSPDRPAIAVCKDASPEIRLCSPAGAS